MLLLGNAVTEQVKIGFLFSFFTCFWITGRAGRGTFFHATSGIASLSFTVLHDSSAKLRKRIIMNQEDLSYLWRKVFYMCVSTKKTRAVKGLSEHKSFLVSSPNGQVESFSFSISFKTVQGRHRVTCCVLLSAEVNRVVILFSNQLKNLFLETFAYYLQNFKNSLANYVRGLLAEHNIPFSFLNEINITIVLNILSQRYIFFFRKTRFPALGHVTLGVS